MSWQALLSTIRWRLGFTIDALRTELQHCEAGRGETLAQYQSRFESLQLEAQEAKTTAARYFLAGMSDGFMATMAQRLEQRFGRPQAETADQRLATI